MMATPLPESWRPALDPVLATPPLRALGGWLRAEEAAGKTIFPPRGARLAALELTPLDAVRVVILGQDPYHGPGQAHGLAFSVLPGVKVPPSLANIYKELRDDLGLPVPRHGHLDAWARQGVLLLNTVLTVQAGASNSHAGRGWERLTDAIVREVSRSSPRCVFILWGKPAQEKKKLVDQARHLVLEAPHPSPLSAHRGFFGSRPFSKTNAWLAKHGLAPIDWRL